MKGKIYLASLSGMALFLLGSLSVEAKTPDNVFESGIYIGEMSVSGMTTNEATEEIEAYVENLLSEEIVLSVSEEKQTSITAGEIGLKWENQEVVEQAVQCAKAGNVLIRYKAREDLKYEGVYYPIELSFDQTKIETVLEEKCSEFHVEPKDATIHREGNQFVVTESQEGLQIDINTSKDLINDILEYQGWNAKKAAKIELATKITQPRVKATELMQIGDRLGSYSTSFKTSGAARTANVANGGSKINGTVLLPGDEFSMYNAVKPFSEANGYHMAGSYMNGQVVDSIGGGICQVSTTLYNAVLQAELEVTMRYNHSMAVSYVEPAFDAAIAESSGKDLIFVNNTDYPIYIECYTVDKVITTNIYGVETRPSNRVVTYENKINSVTYPEVENIYQNTGLPAGYIDVTGAHIGYKSELYKVVYVDGVEQSREKVNTSNYAMSPRSCVVGVATSNTEDYNWLMAAIQTGSIDQVKAVANAIAARSVQPQ